MSTLTFIDDYIHMELNPEDINQFDQRINTDPAFAEELAFYLSTMHVAREQLIAEKKKQFRTIYEAGKLQHKKSVTGIVKNLRYYIVAAAMLTGLLVGYFWYFQSASTQQLADQYINQHFKTAMGIKMDAKQDSLDAAMVLYNDGKLAEARPIFEKLTKAVNAEIPIKMTGIVSLRLGDYDKALKYFIQLENLTLFTNPGKFYHALTLMKRNGPGDKKTARELLQQVIDMNLEEKETAQKWIKEM